MAWTTTDRSTEFGTGTTPTPDTGHVNVAPLAPPSGLDSGLSYEGVLREEGSAQPGSMGKLMDTMSGGSDDAQWSGSEE